MAARQPHRPCYLLSSLLLLGALLWATPALASGPWAQPDRGVYAKWSFGYAAAATQFKETGGVFDLLSDDVPGSFRALASMLYVEYGLLPRFTIYSNATFQQLELDSDIQRARTTGFSDLMVGMRYQFLDRGVVASAFSAVRLPTGYTADPDLMVPALGNGVFEAEVGLAVGASFWPVPVYTAANVAYRNRGTRIAAGGDIVDFADEIPFSAEVGYAPIDRLLLRAALLGVYGLGSPEDLDIFSLTPLTQSYLKVGPSVIYSLNDRLQLSLDYLLTPWGINTVRSQDVVVGLAFEFAP